MHGAQCKIKLQIQKLQTLSHLTYLNSKSAKKSNKSHINGERIKKVETFTHHGPKMKSFCQIYTFCNVYSNILLHTSHQNYAQLRLIFIQKLVVAIFMSKSQILNKYTYRFYKSYHHMFSYESNLLQTLQLTVNKNIMVIFNCSFINLNNNKNMLKMFFLLKAKCILVDNLLLNLRIIYIMH